MICWGLADIALLLRGELIGLVLVVRRVGPFISLRLRRLVDIKLHMGSFSPKIIYPKNTVQRCLNDR